ncbi:hypothetical protein E2C01_028771 [Portunus trituberculatus]|uniref:Secreted protein n=1 Tax=Portunus trituberculatus TaxID=210409 RepID=A0A5B7ELC2_PORTR|nr:hypothetical protein [Portunus trituberculatus]
MPAGRTCSRGWKLLLWVTGILTRISLESYINGTNLHPHCFMHPQPVTRLTSHVPAKEFPGGCKLDAVATPGTVEFHHPGVLCAVNRGREVGMV